MKTALTKKTTFLASLLVVAGAWTIQSCSGDDGSDGKDGVAGANCSVQQTAAGAVLTCPNSEPYTITGGAGSDCRLTQGAGGQTITCGSNSAFISEGGGVGGSVDCKLITLDDMTAGTSSTGVSGKGARQVFSIQCGNGSAAKIGFCGTYNDVYNPNTEKCVDEGLNAGSTASGVYIIVPGVGHCKVDGVLKEYVMADFFCQPNLTTANHGDVDDEDEGVSLQPVCGSGSGYYGTDQFCFGYIQGVSAGKILDKCGMGSTKAEFKQWEFCLQNPAGTAEAVTMRCGFKADSLLTTAQFAAVTAKDDGEGSYNKTSFCQDVSNQVLPLCGGEKYTVVQTCLVSNEIGQFCNNNADKYSITKSFCASQNDKVYALCGITATNTGVFNPITHFCYSDDYGTNNEPDANANGVITPVCAARIYAEGTGGDDDKLVHAKDTAAMTLRNEDYIVEKNIGYTKQEFCSAQDNEVHSLCKYKPRAGETSKVYNTNTYECNTTGATYNDWYLTGKCGETVQSQITYKVAEASCENNKLYPLCVITSTGTATTAFDGPTTYGSTNYPYKTTNTQTCNTTTGAVTCVVDGAVTLSGEIGCGCPATLPNLNTAAAPACKAACTTAGSLVFDPKGGTAGAGACVADAAACTTTGATVGKVNGQDTCIDP